MCLCKAGWVVLRVVSELGDSFRSNLVLSYHIIVQMIIIARNYSWFMVVCKETPAFNMYLIPFTNFQT